MYSRDGGESGVFPEFSLSGPTIEIRFPTTTRVYYLYRNNTGVFGNESFTWRVLESWHDGSTSGDSASDGTPSTMQQNIIGSWMWDVPLFKGRAFSITQFNEDGTVIMGEHFPATEAFLPSASGTYVVSGDTITITRNDGIATTPLRIVGDQLFMDSDLSVARTPYVRYPYTFSRR